MKQESSAVDFMASGGGQGSFLSNHVENLALSFLTRVAKFRVSALFSKQQDLGRASNHLHGSPKSKTVQFTPDTIATEPSDTTVSSMTVSTTSKRDSLAKVGMKNKNDLAGKWSIGGFEDSLITLYLSGDCVKSKEKRFGGASESFEGEIIQDACGELEIRATLGSFVIVGKPEISSDGGMFINFSSGMRWQKQVQTFRMSSVVCRVIPPSHRNSQIMFEKIMLQGILRK